MADFQQQANCAQSDRRTFLSAAGAIGAIGAVAALPAFAATNPRAAWDAAMAQYIKARDAAAVYYNGTYKPIFARYEEWADQNVGERPSFRNSDAFAEYQAKSNQNPHSDAYDLVDEEHESLLDIEADAQRAVMATPAPDRKALRYKLEYILDDSGGGGGSFTADFLEQTVADYRRLLGDA